MQLTCPCCKAHIPLQAALEDDAGRELLGMLAAVHPSLALPLVHYLSFFRPAKQQLGWGRALRLAREVMALAKHEQQPPDRLTAGLVECNRALDEKRALAGWKPLGNHNYLARVLEGVQARAGTATGLAEVAGTHTPTSVKPRSQAGVGLVALNDMRRAT
jgi:hypothetical protein